MRCVARHLHFLPIKKNDEWPPMCVCVFCRMSMHEMGNFMDFRCVRLDAKNGFRRCIFCFFLFAIKFKLSLRIHCSFVHLVSRSFCVAAADFYWGVIINHPMTFIPMRWCTTIYVMKMCVNNKCMAHTFRWFVLAAGHFHLYFVPSLADAAVTHWW